MKLDWGRGAAAEKILIELQIEHNSNRDLAMTDAGGNALAGLEPSKLTCWD